MENLKKLFDISNRKDTVLSEEERNFVNEMLVSNEYDQVIIAAMIVTSENEDHINDILDKFTTYPLLTKKMLIPCLASLQYYKAYKYLFEYLDKTSIPELAARISICLAKTDYPITPYLFHYLEKSDKQFEMKLCHVLKYMGLKKLEKSLAILPIIPKEHVFRKVFGDLEINYIKTISKKHQKE